MDIEQNYTAKSVSKENLLPTDEVKKENLSFIDGKNKEKLSFTDEEKKQIEIIKKRINNRNQKRDRYRK